MSRTEHQWKQYRKHIGSTIEGVPVFAKPVELCLHCGKVREVR